jgi:NAD dependent epimerase/dehydratase family enzyme
MSWVTLEDVVAILRFAIENATVRGAMNVAPVRGPINIVSPRPVHNSEFTKILAKAAHRPALFPAPGFALRLALGEMADALLLSSQRVAPDRLEQMGYAFRYATLSLALDAILTKK